MKKKTRHPDEKRWPQGHGPWTGWNGKVDDVWNFALMPASPGTGHELTTFCSLNTIKLLTSLSRVGHMVLRASAHCGPLCLAKKIEATLFYFTPNSVSMFLFGSGEHRLSFSNKSRLRPGTSHSRQFQGKIRFPRSLLSPSWWLTQMPHVDEIRQTLLSTLCACSSEGQGRSSGEGDF